MVGVRARTRFAGGHFVFRHGMLFWTIPFETKYRIKNTPRARAPEFPSSRRKLGDGRNKV